jgi:hypothetical protein
MLDAFLWWSGLVMWTSWALLALALLLFRYLPNGQQRGSWRDLFVGEE